MEKKTEEQLKAEFCSACAWRKGCDYKYCLKTTAGVMRYRPKNFKPISSGNSLENENAVLKGVIKKITAAAMSEKSDADIVTEILNILSGSKLK